MPHLEDLFFGDSHFGNGLPGRPLHMPATEQVEMQMVHRLPAIVACIRDDSITTIQLLFPRNFCRGDHQVAHQRSIFRERFCSRSDVLLGDNQKMCRRLGIDVGKSDAEFVFIHTVGGDCAGDDLAKQAIGRRGRKGSRT